MTAQEILELQKKNCIFCKIISKEIPSHEIYTDEKVVVILDINPANEGHCLILPKQHYQILPQIPQDLIGYMFVIAKKTSRALLKALGVQGTTIFVANGAIAGQKSPHFMIHVIPRMPSDLLFQVPKHPIKPEDIDKIRDMLAGPKPRQQEKPIEESQQNKAAPEKIAEEDELKEGNTENKDQDDKKEPAKKEKSKREDVSIDDIANLFLKNG